MRYLLDTNVLSELMKPRPNAGVFDTFAKCASECAISSISVQESIFGLEIMPEGKRKKLFTENFRDFCRIIAVLDFTNSCAAVAGEILGKSKKAGISRPYSDTQIAATAVANGLVLVTRNVKDFEPMKKFSSLQYENWFE